MLKLRNKYFILRHGQTIYQTKKKKFVYPWPDNPPVPLTKKGKEQIEKVAKKLKKAKIDLIFASDIFRVRQSAGIVTKELGLKMNPVRKRGFLNGVNFDKRLRDVNLGIYHGKIKTEFYRNFPRDSKKRFSQKPRGGESWSDCKKRIVSFIKEIDKKYKNKNILIISHGDPLWLLAGAIKGLTNEKLLKEKHKNLFLEVGEFKKF